MNQNTCHICYQEIPQERLEALDILGILIKNRTCLKCANENTKSIKAVWSGMTGTSNMIFADSLGQYGIQRDEPTISFEENDIEQEIID